MFMPVYFSNPEMDASLSLVSQNSKGGIRWLRDPLGLSFGSPSGFFESVMGFTCQSPVATTTLQNYSQVLSFCPYLHIFYYTILLLNRIYYINSPNRYSIVSYRNVKTT